MKKFLIFSIISCFWINPAFSQTQWEVSAARSKVGFEVKHLLFSTVKGKFKQFDGQVTTKGEGLENAEIEAFINTKSVNTGNKDRDNHLTTDDFFGAVVYPKMHFKSTSVERVGQSDEYRIIGDLTMRDVTKSVELKAVYKGEKMLKNGKTKMQFSAKGQVNRFDYGLKWNELVEAGGAIVGKDVDIHLDVALFKTDGTGDESEIKVAQLGN